MMQEFKTFAVKGNMVDMAVGIIIGGAFGTIVTSLVNDILMPPIGLVMGDMDFSNLYVNLTSTEYVSLAEAQAAGAATLNYGLFINNIISFLIVAFALFIVIKNINKLKAKEEEKIKEEPKKGPTEVELLAEIRDALKK